MAGPKPFSTVERTRIRARADWFWQQVEKTDTCWNWTHSAGHHGYGRLWIGTRTVLAHRMAYDLVVGPIPDGLTIDHLCRNARCVNPAHLEAVDQQENVRRQYVDPSPRQRRAIDCPSCGHWRTRVLQSRRGRRRRRCVECGARFTTVEAVDNLSHASTGGVSA
jgi:DNA-directed RNA polymerase subunit RPC12/RpoP